MTKYIIFALIISAFASELARDAIQDIKRYNTTAQINIPE